MLDGFDWKEGKGRIRGVGGWGGRGGVSYLEDFKICAAGVVGREGWGEGPFSERGSAEVSV